MKSVTWMGLIGAVMAAGLLMSGRAHPARAQSASGPALQPTSFPTPTPGPDGRIIYIVQEGDSPWRIAAIAGISVEQLMAMNGMLPDDFITPGMQLVLGLSGPTLATNSAPTSEPTASGPPVTPTPIFGTGEVCVLLFIDTNGNARLETGELPLAEGRVTVVNVAGEVAGETTTDETPEGYCFSGLQNGEYNVSAAVPPGYNATTSMSLPLRLAPGEIKYVEFGAQPSGALGGPVSPQEQARSTLLGIVGVALVLAAAGLGYYASRMNRRTPMSLR
ncbi:MAG: LysM peptidoglycan-binding domain-containing protein [Anaerolineales bacterium]